MLPQRMAYVRHRSFGEGDRELKRVLPMKDEAKDEFASKWQGSLVVQKVLPSGTFVLDGWTDILSTYQLRHV